MQISCAKNISATKFIQTLKTKNNKEKFITLTEKVQKLENLLRTEGIL